MIRFAAPGGWVSQPTTNSGCISPRSWFTPAEDAVREIARFDAEVTAIAGSRAARDGDESATEFAPLSAVLPSGTVALDGPVSR